MNWTDNKYISQELIAEKDDLKARDYGKYLWVWEGHCLKILDGAVYKDEMRKMREDGRITNVPYESSILRISSLYTDNQKIRLWNLD